jgi:hypothetical protein
VCILLKIGQNIKYLHESLRRHSPLVSTKHAIIRTQSFDTKPNSSDMFRLHKAVIIRPYVLLTVASDIKSSCMRSLRTNWYQADRIAEEV